MRVEEAIPLLQAACNRPFRELFRNHPEDLRTNKGYAGQLLLKFIDLKLDCNLCDFEDGELKTNKALPGGIPLETMFVTQIARTIDSLLAVPPLPFAQSNLYQKIRNLLYLPVVKNSGDAGTWYFERVFNLRAEPGSLLYQRYEADYNAICQKLRQHADTSLDQFIHTSNGPYYLQVRSKDAKPYHPIFSKVYGRNVSDKNHAFYFTKRFMEQAVRGLLPI